MSPNDEFTHDDEHQHAEEGQWISSEPPVDDFGDANAETETASVSEGTEPHHEESAPVEEKKKKSLPLLIGGGVVLVAVLGGVGYWKFAAHQQDQDQISLLDMSSQASAALNDAAKQASSAVPAVPAPAVAPTGAFGAVSTPNAPDSTQASASQAGAAAVPSAPAQATTSPTMAMQAAVATTAAPQPAAAVAPAAPTASPSMPAVAKAGGDNGVTDATAAPAADARLSTLSSRMDDLQKSLAQMTQQLGQISGKLSEPQAAPDTATAERLDRLEQKLTQIEQHQSTPSSHRVAVNDVAPFKHAKKATHKALAHKTKHKESSSAEAVAAEAPHTLSLPGSPPATAWVLRAATPDEAWVAKSVETRELRPVHVGDVLPGVGTVKSITQVAGVWQVQGTAGAVQ